MTASDIAVSLSLLGLWPLAWCLPSRSWHRISRLVTEAKAVLLRSYFPSLAPTTRLAFPHETSDFLTRIDRELDANRRELRMQILRKNAPWDWQPDIDLEGTAYLEDALQAGRGVVLWMSHFVYCGFMAKIALYNAGYDVTHLSRPEHGFSKTKFGISVLNPLRCRVEDPYLHARIVINKSTMHATMRRMIDALKDNGTVSITAGAWEGRQIVSAPMFAGHLRLATGAPGLAWSAGAPLLPVHGFRAEEGQRFQVVIDKPLDIDRSLAKRAFVQSAALQYVDRVKPFVGKYPGQWRGWSGL